MNTEYGTLTIRREIFAPCQYGNQNKDRLATLVTYSSIEQSECEAIIERFCEANKMSRRELFCQWKLTVVL